MIFQDYEAGLNEKDGQSEYIKKVTSQIDQTNKKH